MPLRFIRLYSGATNRVPVFLGSSALVSASSCAMVQGPQKAAWTKSSHELPGMPFWVRTTLRVKHRRKVASVELGENPPNSVYKAHAPLQLPAQGTSELGAYRAAIFP